MDKSRKNSKLKIIFDVDQSRFGICARGPSLK